MSAVEPDPLRIAAQVCAVLESLGVKYSIGGSIASSLSGEPRSTLDIDIVVSLDTSQIAALTRAVEAEFYVEPSSLERAIRDRTSANLIHRDTSMKVDLFIAGGTPLDDDLLRRRLLIEIAASGKALYAHTPEDILLQKLRWYRRGGDVSDRQWRDVLGIVRVQGSRLDRDYLSDGATRLGSRRSAEPRPARRRRLNHFFGGASRRSSSKKLTRTMNLSCFPIERRDRCLQRQAFSIWMQIEAPTGSRPQPPPDVRPWPFRDRVGPVGDHVDRRCGLLLRLRDDQETLSIGRDGLMPDAEQPADARLKQHLRFSPLERRRGVDGDAHDRAVLAEVEQFAAVAAPRRLRPAVGRHLPLAAR